MSGIWEGFCTICICGPCKPKLGPCFPLTIVSIFSFIIGVIWVSLGVWLSTIVILNSSMSYDSQLFFEQLNIVDLSKTLVFENESSFLFTPLENLKFYLLSIIFLLYLGGLGRALASLCLLHYVHKKLPYCLSWAWVVLSIFAVVSLASISVDTLYTLSHNDVAPPHSREFYFKNDNYGFYTFCHILKYFIVIDFCTVCYFQWVVRWAQRGGFTRSTTT